MDGLSDQNYKTMFCKRDNKKCAILFNSKNNRVCTTYSNYSNTYVIWTSRKRINFCNNNDNIMYNSLSVNEDDTLQVWHRRLGHYNLGPLRHTLRKS